MESKQSERIKLIQQALQHQKAIHLREMAELLDVSEMTLRRDLNRYPKNCTCWADTSPSPSNPLTPPITR